MLLKDACTDLNYFQNLGLHCKKNEGCLDVTVYCPYWMVNKTGQDIYYKVGLVRQDETFITR